ncbi:MAG: VWA domain-containing protein [Ktedonobacteraceae bacterium]|nr:VWA domain-containing protein [Ktedonobacteraceae bacterium]
MMTQLHEHDVRLHILDTFLSTPHRHIEDLASLHIDALARDPLFYAHLAPWYFEKGAIRDHKTLFVAHLATCEYPEFRNVAWMLMQTLAPYEVARVLDHCKRVINKVPRSLKSAIAHYLGTREKNVRQFDGAALRAREELKHLYASLRLKPGTRAQAILFDRQPPEGSSLAALKRLAKAEQAEEQAQIILDNKIPYTTAIGAVKYVTSEMVAALIKNMSPQEVINNMASLKRHGALEDTHAKPLIDQKLEAAKSDRRVSAFKAKVAVEAAQLSGKIAEQLDAITDAQVKVRGRISRPTALLIDKSSSMHEAIDLGRQIGALVSALCEGGLFSYVFDTEAQPVLVEGNTLADWERALLNVYAGGATSCGAGLARLTKEQRRVEQIILITDEHENRAPFFKDEYAAYSEKMHIKPDVILVKVGQAGDHLERVCNKLGISANVFAFNGDYYALTNLVPLLSQPSKAELIAEILEYPFPERKVTK